MQRGRYLHLATLVGALALSAGGIKPVQAAAINTPAAPILTPADGRVLVTFGGVLNATGYNVYRHAAGAAATLVNATPTTYTWLIDDNAGAGLANGTALFYSVKAVAADKTEGPASLEGVTTPAPPLFGALVAYNITTPGVDPAPGSVTLDTANDLITIHASGDDIWDAQDGQTFAAAPVTGDFTIKARFPGPPTGVSRPTGRLAWRCGQVSLRWIRMRSCSSPSTATRRSCSSTASCWTAPATAAAALGMRQMIRSTRSG